MDGNNNNESNSKKESGDSNNDADKMSAFQAKLKMFQNKALIMGKMNQASKRQSFSKPFEPNLNLKVKEKKEEIQQKIPFVINKEEIKKKVLEPNKLKPKVEDNKKIPQDLPKKEGDVKVIPKEEPKKEIKENLKNKDDKQNVQEQQKIEEKSVIKEINEKVPIANIPTKKEEESIKNIPTPTIKEENKNMTQEEPTKNILQKEELEVKSSVKEETIKEINTNNEKEPIANSPTNKTEEIIENNKTKQEPIKNSQKEEKLIEKKMTNKEKEHQQKSPKKEEESIKKTSSRKEEETPKNTPTPEEDDNKNTNKIKESKTMKLEPSPSMQMSSSPQDSSFISRSTTSTINSGNISLNPFTQSQEVFLQSLDIPEETINESFCEGFFIASFPTENGKVIENSDNYPSMCGHSLCSSLPAMQPEIIFRYPKKDTKTLELNNLAASICFPSGIKICYEEDDEGKITTVKNYSSSITNQQGDRYYMVTYHFYYKILNCQFVTKYSMHPIKYQTMKFCNDYYETIEDNEELQEEISKKLELYGELNFREAVYVPFCLCLISRYPYCNQMEKSLESIRTMLSNYNSKPSEINSLIKYIVRSIPIPSNNTKIKFFLPGVPDAIEIMPPFYLDMCLLGSDLTCLLKLFSTENLITIFQLMLFEQKILIVDSEYERLSEVTNSLVSLLYPLEWIHTYIPIMSDQMIKYLQSFLPFINGIHESLFTIAKPVLDEADEGIFIVYANKNLIDINSNTPKKKIKLKNKINELIPSLPKGVEEKLYKELSKIKSTYEKKVTQKDFDKSEFELKIKNIFIQAFIEMLYDYIDYLTVIEDYPVFDITTMLNNRPHNDQKFYKEFVESQMFQLFIQNMIKEERQVYFNHRSAQYIKLKKEAKKAEILAADFEKSYSEYYKVNQTYYIKPYFFANEENATSNDISQLMIKKFSSSPDSLNEKGVLKEDKRIIGRIIPLEDCENTPTYKYYQLPTKTKEELLDKSKIETNKKEQSNKLNLNRNKYIFKPEGNLSEEEKEQIKENIKDMLMRAFKSEELISKDDYTNLVNLLEKISFAREYFISSIFKDKLHERVTKIISEKCFDFLYRGIFACLISLVKLEVNEKSNLSVILLIKASMLYCKICKRKKIYLYDDLINQLVTYNPTLYSSFWEQFLDWDLNQCPEVINNELDDIGLDSLIAQQILNITHTLVKLRREGSAIYNIVSNIAKNRIKLPDVMKTLNHNLVKVLGKQATQAK